MTEGNFCFLEEALHCKAFETAEKEYYNIERERETWALTRKIEEIFKRCYHRMLKSMAGEWGYSIMTEGLVKR